MAQQSVGMIEPVETEAVKGYLHHPARPNQLGLVLTHGAGSDCNAPLMLAVADAFALAGVVVLRCDLAFRRKRPKGPPFPKAAAADRAGLRTALDHLRPMAPEALYLGGHSYGGRQASMLAAESPDVAAALLLLSYPLHPPDKPEDSRTEHFAKIRTPGLFVSGDKDTFGSIPEIETAIAEIPAPMRLLPVAGAGHDLKKGSFDLGAMIDALLAIKSV